MLLINNLWYIGLFVAVLAGLCLVLDRTHILARLAGKPRQAIPPKKQSSHKGDLPPQRRNVLGKTAKSTVREVDEEEICQHILPMTTNYETCQEQRYISTGSSVQGIRDLGDFPDYSELSGLPNPRPYHEFDIDKALLRPYRPFRWAYYQTMCMSSF